MGVICGGVGLCRYATETTRHMLSWNGGMLGAPYVLEEVKKWPTRDDVATAALDSYVTIPGLVEKTVQMELGGEPYVLASVLWSSGAPYYSGLDTFGLFRSVQITVLLVKLSCI